MERHEQAEAALETNKDYARGKLSEAEAITDLLTNLMHLCRNMTLKFDERLLMATIHFNVESGASEDYETHTPNGFDPAWVSAINQVLEDREAKRRIRDINEDLWEEHIGPMVDAIQAGEYPELRARRRKKGQQ